MAKRSLNSILQDLANFTALQSVPDVNETSTCVYEKDLMASVEILVKLVKYNSQHSERPLSSKLNGANLVKSASDLLKQSNLPVWKTAVKVKWSIVKRSVLSKTGDLVSKETECCVGDKVKH